MSGTNGTTTLAPKVETPKVETPKVETPKVEPTLTPEQARRLANRNAREARENAAKAQAEAKRVAMLALSARLGTGTKVPVKKTGKLMLADEIHAALIEASQTGADVRVTVTIPSTETEAGRRHTMRLASEA